MNRENFRRLDRYLTRCRTPEGGYCHFRDPESGAGFPNVADTCWALEIFRLLGVNPPFLELTRSWLQREFHRNPELHYSPYLSWALEAILGRGGALSGTDRALVSEETRRLLDARVTPPELPLLAKDLFRILSLRRCLGMDLIESERGALDPVLKGLRGNTEGFPSLVELFDRYSLLEIAASFPREELEKMAGEEKNYRHPVFGYVIVPGSSRSDIHLLRSGLLLRRDPVLLPERDRILSMILMGQSMEGGFGPVGGAVPTLEASWASVDVVHFLEKPDPGDPHTIQGPD